MQLAYISDMNIEHIFASISLLIGDQVKTKCKLKF